MKKYIPWTNNCIIYRVELGERWIMDSRNKLSDSLIVSEARESDKRGVSSENRGRASVKQIDARNRFQAMNM